MKSVLYARYSSNNQREESIDAQVRAIEEYASRNNITLVKTYIDEAKSATSDSRPSFLEMISDAKKHLFDSIIVHKLDRFARNKYDSAFYKRVLKESGVKLISVTEYLDDSPESIILESVLKGMAEYYSKNLAREVKKGVKENALMCKHTGGKPPFGYDVDAEKNYVVNKKDAAVRQIFDMVCGNISIGEIISWLNLNGFKTKYNTTFTCSSINAIIRNEKYKGVYVYGKMLRVRQGGVLKNLKSDEVIRIEDGISSIVTPDTWEKANRIFDKRQHVSDGQAKAKETYLLSGLIKCGLCGGSMCGNKVHSGRSKSIRITYKCNTRKAKKECGAKDIRKDLVESIVIDELDRALSETGINYIVEELMAQIKEQTNTIPNEIQELRGRLRQINKQLDSLVETIMNGVNS